MKKNVLNFCFLLTVSVATVSFFSCSKKDDPVAVTGISFDELTDLSFSLHIGSEITLKATVTPEDATDKTITWTSSNPAVASVANGNLTALTEGTTTVTAQAGNQTATCDVTVRDFLTFDEGVVINGVKWATRNVDAPGTFATNPVEGRSFTIGSLHNATVLRTLAANSENAGQFYQWGEDPCPAGWRVPSPNEQDQLAQEVSVWTTQNGVNGRLFGSVPNQIFLPAAGRAPNTNAGTNGYYWSSSRMYHPTSPVGYCLSFDSNSVSSFSGSMGNTSFGYSVRCVAE